MATNVNISEVSTTEPSNTRSAFRLALIPVLAGVLGLLGGGAGTWMYLLHGGHVPLAKIAKTAEHSAPTSQETHPLMLDPFLVNLADPGGSGYLRLSMTLQVADAESRKKNAAEEQVGEAAEKAALRDTVLTVLSRQTSDALLAPNGKDALKKQLLAAFATYNHELKVSEIYFTEMLIQK
ncbi:MAG: flagellar basal body-associated FliL family protein [Acidobacteriaceae bacterium]